MQLEQKVLDEKVKAVVSQFPWYSDLIEIKDHYSFNDLPFMDADILEKFYYNQIQDGNFSVYYTSGTSSNSRKKVYYSTKDDECYVSIKKKIYHKFLGDSLHTAIADMGTGHAASTSLVTFRELGYKCETISFDRPIKEHIRKLAEFKPEVLYTMPSILDSILKNGENVLDYQIKKIILVGEVASKQWISNVASQFLITVEDIMDTYGSIELGTMAFYSHQNECYILVDGMYAEGVQPQDVGIEMVDLESEETILVLTSFRRELFPSIRYITHDVVRGLRTQEIDGKMVQCFDCIVKRVGKEIKHGEKISLYDIENVVYQYVKQAQIRVKVTGNKLKIVIDSNQLTDEILIKIGQKIQHVIPEIGKMIENGILDKIKVVRADDKEIIDNGAIKNKKLYFEE